FRVRALLPADPRRPSRAGRRRAVDRRRRHLPGGPIPGPAPRGRGRRVRRPRRSARAALLGLGAHPPRGQPDHRQGAVPPPRAHDRGPRGGGEGGAVHVISDVGRVLLQVVHYALRRRSFGLLVFLLLGIALVAVTVFITFASPALIYPLL